MKSFVVLSYYQLLHAIAMTLDIGEKTNLYFSSSHLGVEQDFQTRIKQTGLFNDVVFFDHRAPNSNLLKELEKTAGMSDSEIDAIGTSLFEKYLGDFYAEIFSNADFDDELYLYNDFQPHYYYIANHFHNIIGVEDGYGILEKQINLINNTGVEAFNHGKYKSPFIGKYWPEMQWKNDAVKTVISSVPLTSEAPEYLKNKVKVLDYQGLVQKHKEEHKKVLESIFDFSIPDVEPNSSIVLTQPLHRNKYCNPLEDYLLHRKLILDEKEEAEVVYIKPHPADRIDYRALESDNIVLLDKRFPAEFLFDGGITFDRVSTFMSAAADGIAAKKQIKIFDAASADREQIVKAIKNFIKKEMLEICYFVRVRNCSPEAFVNAYLLPGEHKRVKTNVYLLFDKNSDCNPDYFDPKNARERVTQYFEEKRRKKEHILWGKEIKELPQTIGDVANCFHYIDQADCSDAGIAELIQRTDCDLFFITDISNCGIELRNDITTIAVSKSLKLVQSFSNHTVINGNRYEIGIGETNSVITNTLNNRLCCKSLLNRAMDGQTSFFGPLKPVFIGEDSLRSYVRSSYYVDAEDCNLLNETVDSLCRSLKDCETADQEGCIIEEMAVWLNLHDRPVSDLEFIFNDIGYDSSRGLLKAYLSSTDARNRENNRFTVKNANEYKYVREILDNMLSDGTFEKVESYYSLKDRVKKKDKNKKKKKK